MPSVARVSTPFKRGVLKPLHLNQIQVYDNKSNDKEEMNKGDNVKNMAGIKNEKKNHRMKKKKKKGNQNRYDPSGQQKVHVPQSAFKESTKATKSLRGDGSISSGYSQILLSHAVTFLQILLTAPLASQHQQLPQAQQALSTTNS